MTLESEDEISKAIGEPSLENLPADKYPALVGLFSEIPDDLQLELIKKNPGLQKYTLQAVAAVEHDLRYALESNDKSTMAALDTLADIRKVLKGELDKNDISDERWRFLIGKLIENGQMAIAKDTENKQFIAAQTNAARFERIAKDLTPFGQRLSNMTYRFSTIQNS